MSGILDAGVAIYVAMAVALACWIGIFFYLWRIDAHARELRRRIEQLPDAEQSAAPTATLRAQERPATKRAETAQELAEKP